MGLNTRIGTAAPVVITTRFLAYSSNPAVPTGGKTIADGAAPNPVELMDVCENLQTMILNLIDDVAALRAQLNSGE